MVLFRQYIPVMVKVAFNLTEMPPGVVLRISINVIKKKVLLGVPYENIGSIAIGLVSFFFRTL